MKISYDQRTVALGMVSAFIASVLIVVGAIFINVSFVENNSLDARFQFAAPFLLLSAIPQVLGIVSIASYRFFNQNVIDGSNPESDQSLQLKRAYLQNTTEQTLLAWPIYGVLTIVLPLDWIILVAVLPVWFVICRALFSMGYKRGVGARSFGFAGTFYATLIGGLIAAWFSVIG